MTTFHPLCTVLIASTLMTACSHYNNLPAGTVQQFGVTPVVEQQQISVTPDVGNTSPTADYLIGAGDLIQVQVYGRPELGTVTPGSGQALVGSRVDGSGAIRLPLVGSVKIAGLTLEQACLTLQESYSIYVREPSVSVEVIEFKSQPIYLLGQFKHAGVFYLDRPMTILQGMALGGGFDVSANVSSARLLRDNRPMPIDINRLLNEGGVRENIWLQSGDALYVPDNRSQFIFVFGAVKKPGALPYPASGLNLAQAIASAELRDVGVNDWQVRIIRSLSTTQGELYVVDFTKIINGEALPFILKEGDIVFVPKSGVGTWNDAINELLPSLQTVSALLNPFVQIKFLSEN